MFLPVKTDIRKKIGKQEGDWVHIVLYPDHEPVAIPDEFLRCLKDDPVALKCFSGYTEAEKKAFIDWIYAAKKEETKVDRIAKTLVKLADHKKMFDK